MLAPVREEVFWPASFVIRQLVNSRHLVRKSNTDEMRVIRTTPTDESIVSGFPV
jgi:hypothetical protein